MKHGYCLQRHSSYLCEGRHVSGAGPDNYHLCHQRLCLFVASTKLSVATLFCFGVALLHSSIGKPSGVISFLSHFCPWKLFFYHMFLFYLYLFFTIVSPDSSPTRVVNPSETSVDSAKWYCGTKTSHCFRFSAVMTTFCDVYQVEQNTRGLDTELAKQRCWSHDGQVKVTPIIPFFAIAFNFLLPIFH